MVTIEFCIHTADRWNVIVSILFRFQEPMSALSLAHFVSVHMTKIQVNSYLLKIGVNSGVRWPVGRFTF